MPQSVHGSLRSGTQRCNSGLSPSITPGRRVWGFAAGQYADSRMPVRSRDVLILIKVRSSYSGGAGIGNPPYRPTIPWRKSLCTAISRPSDLRGAGPLNSSVRPCSFASAASDYVNGQIVFIDGRMLAAM